MGQEVHPPIKGADGRLEQAWLTCRLCRGSGVTRVAVRLMFEPPPPGPQLVDPHPCHRCGGKGGQYVRVEYPGAE